MNTKELYKLIKKLPRLFFGFFLCSLGILMTLKADMGVAPWDIFHKGITLHTSLTFGEVTQITGLAIIILSIPLGIIPGIGTIFNMYFIGLMIDFIDKTKIIFTPSNIFGKLLLLLLGICILSEGLYFYLSCGLGAGPRDGLMLGLMHKFNISVSKIKTIIELSALVIGTLLGGPLGFGTVIVALTIGHTTQIAFNIGKFDAKKTRQNNLKDQFNSLFKYKKVNQD